MGRIYFQLGRIYFQLWIFTSSQTTGLMLPHGDRGRASRGLGLGPGASLPTSPVDPIRSFLLTGYRSHLRLQTLAERTGRGAKQAWVHHLLAV